MVKILPYEFHEGKEWNVVERLTFEMYSHGNFSSKMACDYYYAQSGFAVIAVRLDIVTIENSLWRR